MATSTLPTVISTLVTSLQGAGSLSGVKIYDGIEVNFDNAVDVVAIGHDGNLDTTETNAGSARQEYKALGASSKFEYGSVNCVLWAQSGDSSLSTLRARAFVLLGAIETVIRTDVSLGAIVMWSGIESLSPTYLQTELGAAVQIAFTVTYQSRI